MAEKRCLFAVLNMKETASGEQFFSVLRVFIISWINFMPVKQSMIFRNHRIL